MAAEDEKLEIVPEQAVEVRETRTLFRLAPAADNDLGRPSRQVAIVAADTEEEARQIASMNDAFGLAGSALRGVRCHGDVGDARFRRCRFSVRAGAVETGKRVARRR
jgi:hypothetical protein